MTPQAITVRPRTPHKFFSPGRVWAIATNTLLELIRLKVFYFLLLFALLIIGSSAFMLDFRFQEQFQVLKDMSLGSMEIFSWLLAVLATSMLLPKEIEDRTLYTILAKPVPRFEYLMGKLLGILVLLLTSILLMSAMFVVALYIKQQEVLADAVRGVPADQVKDVIRGVKASSFTASLVPCIVMIYIKSAFLASFTLLVSTFATSSIFTVIVSFVVYFIGHVQGIARESLLSSPNASALSKIFLAFVSLMFPDLRLLSLTDDVVAGNVISTTIFLKTAGLGLSYFCVYALVAYLIFAFKEL